MLLQLKVVRPVLAPTSFTEASSPHEVVSPRLFIALLKYGHFLGSPIHWRFEEFHVFLVAVQRREERRVVGGRSVKIRGNICLPHLE